jgi:uncharacterized protein
MRSILSAFISAVIFGIGLAISGMIDPTKVQGFLDIAGRWNPSLAFVMGGALGVTAIGYAVLRKRGVGFFNTPLQWSTRNTVDAKLIGGAALFGVGWGLAGYCPGPALGAIALGSADAVLFVVAMALAMAVTRWLAHTRSA